jgi:uncharacterized sulfatase
VSCKGLAEPNKTYDGPISHIDIAPTILDFAGIPVPRLLQGKSLLPAIRGENVKINEHIFMEFERYEIDHDGFGGYQPLRAIFDGRYKLVINLLSGDELYDLADDPYELKNLICEGGEIRNRLHGALLDWQNKTRDPLRGYYWERREWQSNAIRPSWAYTGMTRQRENEEYEPRQLDYDTGLEMSEAVRKKF